MTSLTIKLKQHTPLIHFQHEQANATLRATELKPKLDKFIIQKLKKAKTEYHNLLLGKQENEALDYKLSIHPLSKVDFFPIESIILDKNGKPKDSFPGYFANMGMGLKKQFSFCEWLELKFVSFNAKVLTWIKEYVADFLASTNFGTRQSKGFGSFYIAPDCKSGTYRELSESYKYHFSVNNETGDWYKNYFRLFEHIDLFYRAMRSGINIKAGGNKTTFYFKSLLFLYAKHKGWQWDKKTVKQTMFGDKIAEQMQAHGDTDILKYASSEKYLLRDVFGLSSDEQWQSYRTSVTKENDAIERFKSPIRFKPIAVKNGFEVYFKADSVKPNFLDKPFTLNIKGHGRTELYTPKAFSFKDFFDFIFLEQGEYIKEFDGSYFEIDTHVDRMFQKHESFIKLRKIFHEIQDNLIVQ